MELFSSWLWVFSKHATLVTSTCFL